MSKENLWYANDKTAQCQSVSFVHIPNASSEHHNPQTNIRNGIHYDVRVDNHSSGRGHEMEYRSVIFLRATVG